MQIHVITIFPEMFSTLTEQGVVSRWLKEQQHKLSLWNPRDFTKDVHRTVDDRPYGGGPGMVMMPEPLFAAIEAAKTESHEAGNKTKVIFLTPVGQVFNHAASGAMAEDLQSGTDLIFLCGRYEGVDQRVIDELVDEQWSLGDFVLSGGEIPAMAMIDAIARHLPGCLGNKDSFLEDSFVEGLLDYGHYTRPENFKDQVVPAVLLSGDHQRIKRWRQKQSLRTTLQQRPDLLKSADLSADLQALLSELLDEIKDELS